jgi:hypothetical protein
MLNFALKGTYQDPSGYSWDYYRDDQRDPNPNPNTFYIIPQPQFVMQPGTNKPVFSIIKNVTDGSDNGSGTCQFEVELSVPQLIQAAISTSILGNSTEFPGVTAPNFVTLQWNQGGSVGFMLTTDSVDTYFSAPVSGFGGSVASFLLPLSSKQLATCTAAFSSPGGTSSITITYNLSVPARLQGVSAVLTFDSSIAYQYQVTQPTYNSWGDETSPRSVQSFLQESNSSKVTLNWGTASPPPSLVTEVTSWANNTIADLVNAEVKKEIAIQDLQSNDSFDISEVSNFTATFNENMVVNWIINPQVVLPSFPGMQLDIANFIQPVNEQQQIMVVSTNLPFIGTPAPYVPIASGGSVQPLVENVVVTVSYPGLPEATNTNTFTNNSNYTFKTAYDTKKGGLWSINYTVNFQDKTLTPLIATINEIKEDNYILSMADAGILTVNFDATNAFTIGKNIPEKIEVNLSFVNTNTEGSNASTPFNYTLVLTSDILSGAITSLQALPITSSYNYQATYYYKTGVPFPAPAMQNQTGFNKTIAQAAGEHQVNAIVIWLAADAAGDQLLSGTVSLWYDTPPNLPSWYDVSSLPTKANPTVFDVTVAQDSKSNSIGQTVFYGLTTNNEPLYYTATLTPMIANQIIIESQLVQNTINTIKISPTQRYFTLVADPAAVDWKTDLYSQIQVQVTFAITQGTADKPVPASAATQVMTVQYNNGEIDLQYLTLAIQTGNVVTYACEVTYISGTSILKNNYKDLTDLTFNIPAKPQS